ncbi:MAG: SEC-C domain-containing protein [Desulfovibrio sp.]|nr:SEC-C domain-containing protein [Desulfovibrio sp.]
MSDLCPCGSGRLQEDCCIPYITGNAWPADAQTLMRSRYTAYVLQRYQWLVESTHPEYRENISVDTISETARDVHWLGLDIRSVAQDVPAGEKGERFDVVEFYAYYELDGLRQLGERSFFQRKDGKVYYVDGVPLKPAAYHRDGPKVGRNDPCPCGSGKKYKKCCGKAVD